MGDVDTCSAVGEIVVSGTIVGYARCILAPGHDEPREVFKVLGGTPALLPATPHVARLEWTDDPIELDEPAPDDTEQPGARPCPECIAGKHANCDSTTWDNERDHLAWCPCSFNDHAT